MNFQNPGRAVGEARTPQNTKAKEKSKFAISKIS
jgi:hypothetical protein